MTALPSKWITKICILAELPAGVLRGGMASNASESRNGGMLADCRPLTLGRTACSR